MSGEIDESLQFALDQDWNEDIEEDVNPTGIDSLVVFSRDWTVETIVNQIEQGNIDLNPAFQRRNAWDDDRRSKLIESLITGLPVPEVVLAEDPSRKRSFIVIDGKQRLLTIAGYVRPEIGYWKKAVLSKLTVRRDLDGVSFHDLSDNPRWSDELRQFINADVRCTVISNHRTSDVLYDIFYRLNTGSVPLSTQELRQVLHKGPFADYLIAATNELQPIHNALRLRGADSRLRDVELLLRFIALVLFGDSYRGNLKLFLDEAMRNVTEQWEKREAEVHKIHDELNLATERLIRVLGKNVGTKYSSGRWENRFNKVLFEVEAYYFRFLGDEHLADEERVVRFVRGFQYLCSENEEFRSSIEATTKTNERYEARFSLFQNLVNEVFETTINSVPVRAR